LVNAAQNQPAKPSADLQRRYCVQPDFSASRRLPTPSPIWTSDGSGQVIEMPVFPSRIRVSCTMSLPPTFSVLKSVR
jgi:hypothetical protein